MLKIITGRAKTGKSEYCSREFARSAVSQGAVSASGMPQFGLSMKPSYYIVPEQYTVEAEKRILALDNMKNRALMGSEVLSFRRLSHRILGKYGGLSERMMSRRERTIILTAAIRDVSDRLEYYSGILGKPSEILSMMAFFDELEAYNPDVDSLTGKLELLIDQSSGLRKAKLTDALIIFTEYINAINKSFTTSSRALEKACSLARENGFFSGLSVWVDEFTGFTDSELSMVSCMLESGAEVTVSLCTSRENEPVFYAIDRTLDRLKEMAVNAGSGFSVSDISEILPPETDRRDNIIRSLERAYTALKPEPLPMQAQSPGFPVEIFTAQDQYTEILYAADKIAALVEEGFSYSDIVVAVRDVGDYSGYVGPVFSARSIPFFIDDVRNIYSNPAVATVRAIIDLYVNNMERKDVCALLKNGMIVNDRSRQDELENYILSHNFNSPKKYKRSEIEELSQIYSIYEDMKAVFSGGASVSDAAERFTKLLIKLRIDKKAAEISEELEKEGFREKAEEFRRVWNIIADTLGMIKELMGGREADERYGTAEMLKNYIETGFAGIEIGFIPQERNCVRVIGTGRSRTGSPKAVLLLGVNEGVMPREVSDSGILRDYERQIMEEAGIGLADSSLSRAYKELFMVYSALFSASDRIYISYAQKNQSGDELIPSSKVVKKIEKLLPGIVVKDATPAARGEEAAEDNEAREQGLTGTDNEAGELSLPGTDNGDPDFTMSPELSHSLLIRSDEPQLSVSQIESYNYCPMSYLLERGLNIRERDEGDFASNDIGSIMHKVVEDGGKKLARVCDAGMSDEEIAQLSKELSDEYFVKAVTNAYPEFDLIYSEKNKLMMRRLKNFCTVVLNAVGLQYKCGQFKTIAFECEFGKGDTLPPVEVRPISDNINKILIGGKIDRLDAFSDGERIYVSVVDYKSSAQNISRKDISEGLRIQLITYMKAASETQEARDKISEMAGFPGEQTMPGAGLYFVFGDGIDKVKNRAELSKGGQVDVSEKFSMSGFLLNSEAVVKGLNGETKKGVVKVPKSDKLISFDEFEKLSETVNDVIARTESQIASGDFCPRPKAAAGKGNGYKCEYCPYAAVCGVFYLKKNQSD